MNKQIFIDTGFIIALIHQKDQYHYQALELFRKYEDSLFITTDVILLEFGNACSRHSKIQAIQIIEDFQTSDNVDIVLLTQQLFQKGFELYKQYQDKTWGLIDCISFVVMSDLKISQVLTFDKHFSQAGFTILN